MQDTTRTTLRYYTQHAKDFAGSTENLDMTALYAPFLSRLSRGARILDFGCGSGRDSAAFLEMGYEVFPVDGSPEMCAATSARTGLPVRQMLFEELDDKDAYDGIWACSSILHAPREQLADIIRALDIALMSDGIIYTSFKYGEEEGERHGRWFTDFTEDSFLSFLSSLNTSLQAEKLWCTADVRPEREKKWLNILLRKS